MVSNAYDVQKMFAASRGRADVKKKKRKKRESQRSQSRRGLWRRQRVRTGGPAPRLWHHSGGIWGMPGSWEKTSSFNGFPGATEVTRRRTKELPLHIYVPFRVRVSEGQSLCINYIFTTSRLWPLWSCCHLSIIILEDMWCIWINKLI